MNFEQAIQELRKGKKVRRSHWKEFNGFVWVDKQTLKIYNKERTKEGMQYYPTWQKIQAIDWEVVEEEFCLSEAREGLKHILVDKTSAGFNLDEETTRAILHLIKTSDKIFIKKIKEIYNYLYHRNDEIPPEMFNDFINRLAGDKLNA